MKRLISYAQNREDMILHVLLHEQKKGFYVDVGGYSPDEHSVTKFFYLKGWSGINIEPTKELYNNFTRRRKRDTNLNIAIADQEGQLIFREYPHHGGLSTLDKKVMKYHEKNKLPYKDYAVKVVPLKKVLKQQKVKEIDFLKIDVEGHEISVINSNDWDVYRPKVVCIEATHLDLIKRMFKKLDYRYEFFDGLNLYFVDGRYKEISILNYSAVLLSYGYQSSQHADSEATVNAKQNEIAMLEERLLAIENRHEELVRKLRFLRKGAKPILLLKRKYVDPATSKLRK